MHVYFIPTSMTLVLGHLSVLKRFEASSDVLVLGPSVMNGSIKYKTCIFIW